MKILVCISNVPDTTTKISFTPDNKELNTAGVQFVINPYDEYALTRAIELKESQGGTVTVLNVGLADTEANIRKALAIGADDAIRVNAKPTDAFFVAQQIAQYAKEGGYDLILMGKESVDYNGFQVHGMVAELLGWPAIVPAIKLDVTGTTATLEREIEGGKEIMQVNLPLVASAQQPMSEPRIPNMRGIMTARTKPLNVVEPISSDVKTKTEAYTLPEKKSGVKLIDPANAGELITLLRNEAKVI
ncbi:electron transfer flavoprotein subunit beta/FixA family protein [Adhaeribacter radiodurans]|uniref:Electron transfer flavoprotein subunit beta n=1 Tax=Adhaeribacter radiodurans TaxID=2745197 RepID=A0A7L7LAW2_9BACT|nr:electron transfer flavoprotein subunit beta/FixA family protein [Adhaeribacter radiodurans]QMU29549.1 electron transfer flavoprotein subunit beta/FixA family protein [Adhaeribacter radiodurans]